MSAPPRWGTSAPREPYRTTHGVVSEARKPVVVLCERCRGYHEAPVCPAKEGA